MILITFLAFVFVRKKYKYFSLRSIFLFLSPHVHVQLHPDRLFPRSSTYNICHRQGRRNTDNLPVRIKAKTIVRKSGSSRLKYVFHTRKKTY